MPKKSTLNIETSNSNTINTSPFLIPSKLNKIVNSIPKASPTSVVSNNSVDDDEEEVDIQLKEIKLLRGMKHMMSKLNLELKNQLQNTKDELATTKNNFNSVTEELNELKKSSQEYIDDTTKTIKELQNHINLTTSKFDKQKQLIEKYEEQKNDEYNEHILWKKKYNEMKELSDELTLKCTAYEREMQKLSAINLNLHSMCYKAGLITNPKKDIDPESLTTEYPFVMKIYEEDDKLKKKIKKLNNRIMILGKQLDHESIQRKRLWQTVNDLKISLLSGQANSKSDGMYTKRSGRMLESNPLEEIKSLKSWCERIIKRSQERESQLEKFNGDSTYIEELKCLVGMEMGVNILEIMRVNEKLETISENLLEDANDQYNRGQTVIQKQSPNKV